jgi:hypothetical protein
MTGETIRHKSLKQLALAWAQRQGFTIAGVEVSVPRLGCSRLDAAAARPVASLRGGPAQAPVSAIFECKQSRPDFLRDARCEETLGHRLSRLQELKALYEDSMRRHFPTLRTGEALFPEFDGYRFDAAGFEPYEQIVDELRTLTRRLHAQTKLGKLIRWDAANLCYLVVEPGVAKLHEVPAGWGLLVRCEELLEVAVPATWREVPEAHRWELLQRIALSGTRATYRQIGLPSGWSETEAVTAGGLSAKSAHA